jgi:hypothetical protein
MGMDPGFWMKRIYLSLLQLFACMLSFQLLNVTLAFFPISRKRGIITIYFFEHPFTGMLHTLKVNR